MAAITLQVPFPLRAFITDSFFSFFCRRRSVWVTLGAMPTPRRPTPTFPQNAFRKGREKLRRLNYQLGKVATEPKACMFAMSARRMTIRSGKQLKMIMARFSIQFSWVQSENNESRDWENNEARLNDWLENRARKESWIMTRVDGDRLKRIYDHLIAHDESHVSSCYSCGVTSRKLGWK